MSLSRAGFVHLAATVVAVVACGGWVLALGTPVAAADACPNAQNVGFSPSLPDCRAYEQVSPVDKNAGQAGVLSTVAGRHAEYTLAGADGDSVFYGTQGGFNGFGSTDTGFQWFSVSTRSSSGWATRGVVPSENQTVQGGGASTFTNVLPSADFSQLAAGAYVSFVGTPQNAMDLVGSSGSVSWLSQPTISDAEQPPGATFGAPPTVAGASSSLNAIYFCYKGTLLPSDDVGNPAFGGASRQSLIAGGAGGDVGFYEWTPTGGLTYAGVLPDGSVDPYGAVPAAYGTVACPTADGLGPTTYDNNQVSSDGSRAFFVSPGADDAPASDPPELYVRETASDGSQRTVLISKSAVTGQPAADSPLPVPMLDPQCPYKPAGADFCPASYVYASPDGSHVFFEDVDALTSDAPNDGSVKEYEFDTTTNTLSYLRGVDDQQPGSDTAGTFCAVNSFCYSPILTSTPDGSEFLFVKETAAGDSIDLWSAGDIQPIAQFPEGVLTVRNIAEYGITEARATADARVLVFETNSPIYTTSPGQFNNSGGFEQVYRYDTASGQLACVSCAPAGMQNTGDANMTNDGDVGRTVISDNFFGVTDSRGISTDGNRVFFDSPDPLLPQATNGKRNVYEWAANGDGSCTSAAVGGGCLYLISSGQSADDSFFLDNSANGDNVFFATSEGLVPQDTDGAYDVYDARVDGGFPAPSGTAACAGDSCQGAPNGPPALPTAATIAFGGPGNESTAPAPTVRVLSKVVRGSAFLLRVRVSSLGRISIAGASVKPTSRAVSRSGTYDLRVALTAKAKRALAHSRRLKLILKVRYAPPGASASVARVSLTVMQAAHRKARARSGRTANTTGRAGR